MLQHFRRNGFTLMEVMIVTVIIGILSGSIVYSMRKTQRRAAAYEGEAVLRAIAGAQRLYYADHLRYYVPEKENPTDPPTPTGHDPVLNVNARNKQHFQTYTIDSTDPNLMWTATVQGTGGNAADVTVTVTQTRGNDPVYTRTGI